MKVDEIRLLQDARRPFDPDGRATHSGQRYVPTHTGHSGIDDDPINQEIIMSHFAQNSHGASTPNPAASTAPHSIEYYVDADEGARFIKVDRRTILRWAREGRLPAHPLDPTAAHKDWRFLLSELDAWLRGQVHSTCRSCRSHGGRIQ